MFFHTTIALNRYTTITVALFLVFIQLAMPSFGQLGISFDVKKPKEYENRVLRSEKSDKKFTAPKRFIQNTVTHYNYFFNANNKLNDVMERAKRSFKDDYSQLIPFYNYSLDQTAADSIQLDSVSYKAQTAIILHDLRSDWADNMYILWGASYYLQKEFDSAYLMFQFINYAFAEKEKDGYYKTIGSARDGNSALSISTKEKNGLVRRIFTEPPSRNDAFIWQIRNHLAQNQFSQASTLILALQNDVAFPVRLKNDLEEVQALYFYKQNIWDSAAFHLEKALSNATSKQEKARWEFLLGQLYERSGQFTEAEKFYSTSINHTTDLVMDVYARLATIRVNKDGGENYIDKNVAELVKMARRDKYFDYRDIIYYMAAQMELERNNTEAALPLLLKSTLYTANNLSQRNKAFLQLADISFSKKLYKQSLNFYDSLNMDDTSLKNKESIAERKSILERLIANIAVIERQDSLQRIAALPDEERVDLVKKMVRRLRKQQGLKEENIIPVTDPLKAPPPPSLFNDNKKGEWYFYNTGLRQKGITDFKTKWGMRQNIDNWRRASALSAGMQARNKLDEEVNGRLKQSEELDISFEGLYEKLPLTPEKLKISKDSVEASMADLGILYIQELEDCTAGTAILEKVRSQYPKHAKINEVLFNLYYCYNKQGETAKAAAIKTQMTQDYPRNNYTTIVTTGKNPQSKSQQGEPTKAYEKIYDLFIEGNFAEAIARKKSADSIYAGNYWTPQLLYIEAVYYIKQKEDSIAKTVLTNIINQFGTTPIGAKAVTMLDVLSRRQQIEEELRNLVIVMPVEDSSTKLPVTTITTPPVIVPPPVKKDSVVATKPITDTAVITRPVIKDTTAIKPIPADTTANKPVIKDSAVTKPIVKDSTIKLPPVKKDTVATKPPVLVPESIYSFAPESPQYVVILLNKVDPIFVSEARNAFFRYNKDIYFNKQMQAELVEIDAENRFLLISPFKNVKEAVEYIDQTKPKTATDILPWLKGGKYSYLIITDKNLEVLKNSKDINKYQQFLQQTVPGKF